MAAGAMLGALFVPAASATSLVAGAPASSVPSGHRTVAASVVAAEAVPEAVISLGDSYSSGLGAGDYQDDCDRTPRAWGMNIFGDAVSERTLLACSGARIADVRDQVDDLAALPGEPGGRLVTVTVGGNDIGFADELINCFTPFVSCLDRGAVISDRIDALHGPLVELYTSIQDVAPGDEIIVGGYPMLVPDPAVRSDCPALTGLLSTAERQMIRRLGVALNDAIDAAAVAAGVESAATELEETFAGHAACANGPADWLNGLKFSWPSSAENETDGPNPDGPNPDRAPTADESRPPVAPRWDVIVGFVQESFHPNIAGQAGYADAFEQAWGVTG